jgi:hypothetical protein
MGHYEDDEKHCSQHDLKLNFTMINGTPRIESSQRPEKETFDKSSFNEFPSMVLFVNSMNGGQQQGGQSPALSVHSATDSTITLESPPISRQQSEDSNEATKEITELNNTIKPISSSNESSTIITTRQQTLNNNVLDLTLTSPTIGSGSSSSSTQLQHHNPINLTNNPIGFMNNNLAALIVQSRLAMANANLIGNSGTSTGEQTELFPFMRQSMSIPFHIAQQQVNSNNTNILPFSYY